MKRSYKNKCVELGLSVSALSMHLGQRRTFQEMKNFIDAAAGKPAITRERLRQIESNALRKCRIALKTKPELQQELKELFGI